MSFKDDLLVVLSGGLPALVDGPQNTGGSNGMTPTGEVRTVEKTAPEPQLQDIEAFRVGNASVTNGQVKNLAFFALAGLAVFFIAREL